MPYNTTRSNKRIRCQKCNKLSTMVVDRIVKGKRQVVCMSCFSQEDNECESS